MKYEYFIYTSKEEVSLLINDANSEDLVHIIIGAVNGINDWEWLQELCLKYIHHSDFWVSKTAISCLGDIARIHKKLQNEKVIINLRQIENDKLKGVIESAIEDISIFSKNSNGW